MKVDLMKLRLFAVRHLHSRTPEPGTYPDKDTARAARDVLNNNKPAIGSSQPGATGEYVVTYGPDHRHYCAA